MWVCLSDAFLSIVNKDCRRDELLVRARRPGDIEKVFPNAIVKRDTAADYLFRAVVPRREVARALSAEAMGIGYGNFKDSVQDDKLHNAYLRCWTAMAEVQPSKPYSGLRGSTLFGTYSRQIDEDTHLMAHGHLPDETFSSPPLKVKPRKSRKARAR